MRGNSKKDHSTDEGAYRFGVFELIPSERELRKSGKRLALQPKAFDALLLFVRNAERLVHRDELIDTLWPDTYVTDTNLTNIIVTLRKVLGRDALQTVSKFGYRFCVPVVGEPGIPAATYAIFVEAKGLRRRARWHRWRARAICWRCASLRIPRSLPRGHGWGDARGFWISSPSNRP